MHRLDEPDSTSGVIKLSLAASATIIALTGVVALVRVCYEKIINDEIPNVVDVRKTTSAAVDAAGVGVESAERAEIREKLFKGTWMATPGDAPAPSAFMEAPLAEEDTPVEPELDLDGGPEPFPAPSLEDIDLHAHLKKLMSAFLDAADALDKKGLAGFKDAHEGFKDEPNHSKTTPVLISQDGKFLLYLTYQEDGLELRLLPNAYNIDGGILVLEMVSTGVDIALYSDGNLLASLQYDDVEDSYAYVSQNPAILSGTLENVISVMRGAKKRPFNGRVGGFK